MVEYISHEDDITALRRLANDSNSLRVSNRAEQLCADHHGIDEEAARAELRLLVASAAEKGRSDRDERGFWRLRYEGFSVVLNPSADVIVGYTTLHFERTPSEVLGGSRSRFGRQQRGDSRRTTGPDLPIDVLKAELASRPLVSERLIESWAHRIGCEPRAAKDLISQKVGHDALVGVWSEDTERRSVKRWVLAGSEQCWAIAGDAPLVLASWPVVDEVSCPQRREPGRRSIK